MFEQVFKNIDDILHKDAGCGNELDYVEQSSWLLFLKYMEDLEGERKLGAELQNKPYTPLFEERFRWSTWAAPRHNGKKDLDRSEERRVGKEC